ncbi:hypothetical protein OTB20_37595 [Streptomyces sp. H27-H1]|uniref:hypothetical protein n=1 Tax=Streptomyces sp. H27-H1 TaxID=2996461 RepID=UPI0022703585|nr:hypothetical protein [Streptomyces sp. H27-H1]MCY0931799.1 hypothetical protein [Streptomyces sp. H27-H1]
MSSRTDNRHRAASICRRATGLPLHVCHRWAAEGLITRVQPVPDAVDGGQRAFEAGVVLVLADRLRHEQVEGALLGFTRAEPGPGGLTLSLHPAMADRVVAELLPRIDTEYGGMRGVAGLRLTGGPGQWHLSGLLTGARIRLMHPHPEWTPLLPDDGVGTSYLWRRDPSRLHGIETGRPYDRWGEARDWLLSRLLRRVSLINEAGAAHGWANTYTHGNRGVVVECCAVSGQHMTRSLLRSGLTMVPPDLTGGHEPDEVATAHGQLGLGDALVTVRQAGCAARPQILRGRTR